MPIAVVDSHADKPPRAFYGSNELLKLILGAGETIKVRSGSMLFQAGEPLKGLYVVVKGRFALWSGEDHVRVTRVAERRCLLGLPATIRNKPYSLSAEAVADSQVCFLSPEQFRLLLTSHPAAGAEVLNLLAEEISILRRLAVYEAERTRRVFRSSRDPNR